MKKALLWTILVWSSWAQAGQLANVSLVDTATGERLTIWHRNGQHYVAGTPGQRYRIQVQNRTEGRLLAVVAVDGVNVISGATASTQQQGYVADPWQLITVDGWRKSMDEVAAFYFTSVPDSYAGRTGRGGQAGIIGVALFREQQVQPQLQERNTFDSAGAKAEASAPAPATAARSRLGTGHGERMGSASSYTTFERATDTAEEIITIHYDSRARLIERGIIPRTPPRRPASPQPFPGDFVPDPQ